MQVFLSNIILQKMIGSFYIEAEYSDNFNAKICKQKMYDNIGSCYHILGNKSSVTEMAGALILCKLSSG